MSGRNRHMRTIAPAFMLAAAWGCTDTGSDRAGDDAAIAQPTIQMPQLTAERSAEFVGLALHCVDTEYPNKPGHVLAGPDEVAAPSELHPAFYGCFDWHSAVHGHWALVRQLRVVPGLENAAEIRRVLGEHLDEPSIAAELTKVVFLFTNRR